MAERFVFFSKRLLLVSEMASLLNADLPSEDEMDEDFDPDAEDAAKPAKKSKAAPAGVSRCDVWQQLRADLSLDTCFILAANC